MSADPKLSAKVKRFAQLEMFYRLSPCWRLLLVMILLAPFYPNLNSTKDIGPITEWFLTREVVRFFMAFAPFGLAGPLFPISFFYAIWLTFQLELATKPGDPICSSVRFERVTMWLSFNTILLVFELLSELGCIWVLSEGIYGMKPLPPLFLRVEIGVSMLYLYYRVASLRLVFRFAKELAQEDNSSRLQPTQIQEQNPNPVPPKQTSIAIAIPD